MKKESGERVGLNNYVGVILMSLMDCLAAGVMTSRFMEYLTDYAGLGAFGAIMGAILLLSMRLFDAVNDPIEGWIMDKAKVGKYGKYKPFIFLAIACECVGVSALFFIPEAIVDNHFLVVLWVIVAYLIYDIGASFYAPNLLYRTITLDNEKRGKLMVGPRLMNMIMGMVTGSIVSIINGVNAGIGNMHTAFGVTITAASIGCALIAFIGIAMVKEKYHAPQEEETEIVKITDVFKLFKENDALRTRFISTIFSGFIWTFLFATASYYIKWAYCADLTTGEIDMTTYSTLNLICSMMMLLPLILGTVIANPLMKAFKDTMKFYKFLLVMEAVPCGIMFVLQLAGLLQKSPALFLACMFVTSTAIGVAFIPGETINMMCMDYELYKNGKDRSALCNASTKFLDKAQNAISSGMVGAILVAIGYVVDSETGNFVGDIAKIPTMNFWFIVITGLVPFILGLISVFIFNKYWPITPEIEAEMKKANEASQQ